MSDWWDPKAEGLPVWGAWQAICVEDRTASFTDLSGMGNDLKRVDLCPVPTWHRLDGWKWALRLTLPAGTARMLDTGFMPQADHGQSFLVRFHGLVFGRGGFLLGVEDEIGNAVYGILVFPGVLNSYCNASALSVPHTDNYAGVAGVAGMEGFWNGQLEPGTATHYGLTAADAMSIGVCRPMGDCLSGQWPLTKGYIDLAVIYHDILTHDQMEDVSDAMARVACVSSGVVVGL